MPAPAVSPPRGLVTFVFTDIEGSTRLLHRLGDGYVDLLERHRDVLRAVWESHGGYEVSIDADSFFVAFESADAAIGACLAGQRALAEEPWPAGTDVRVRMGVHAGLATPYRGNYVALAVHQADRVMTAAHGGQVLVSEQAVDAVRVSDRPELSNLGRFRLRDFVSPPRLYELNTGLSRSFPAIRAVPADGHNIVQRRTATIGRAELVAEVRDSISPGCLTTLVGPGGVGKTRVASEIGIAIAPEWNDGVWIVDLAAVGSGELIPAAIGEAVGAPSEPGVDRWRGTLDHLRSRRAVVMLDNCEHVLAGARDLVVDLLAEAPHLSVVATSREPLRIEGELLRPVEPLRAPEPGDSYSVGQSPAVRLFVERGASARPGFELTDDNAATVSEICRHLDGLPLFLELAAANLAVQSPHEVLNGLEDRMRLLRSRDPSLSDRHRTMEGVLGWSYRLLNAAEQVAFRRLAIFGTSFTLATAAAAIGSDDVDLDDVPQLVWSLVDRSLVEADLTANDTRYRLLETIASYGRRLLDDEGQTAATSARLAGAMLGDLGPWLPSDRRWVGDVAVELDNIRALIPLIPNENHEVAQLLACTVGRFHDASQTFRDGIEEVSRYASALPSPSPARVSLLTTLADLHLRTGESETATQLIDAAQELRASHGSPVWDDVGVERARGEVARRSGDLVGAVAIATQTLAKPLSERGRSRMLNLLGTASAALGDFRSAYAACDEELHLNEALGYEGYVASAHGNLAEIALRLGEPKDAARHQRACLELAMAQGSVVLVAFSLIVAARLAGRLERWEVGVQLQAHADVLLDEIGLVLYQDDRAQIKALIDLARSRLGEQSLDAEAARGRALSMPAAAELADRVLADSASG